MAAGAEVEHIKVTLHNILRRRVQLAIFNNLAPAICALQCIPKLPSAPAAAVAPSPRVRGWQPKIRPFPSFSAR